MRFRKELVNNKEEIEKLILRQNKSSKLFLAFRKNLDQWNNEFKNAEENDHSVFCNHPFLEWLSYSLFEWCGCNNGNDNRMLTLYNIMVLTKAHMDSVIVFDEVKSIRRELFGQTYDIVMDMFNNLDIFEHGGSNNACWMSEFGECVFVHIEEWIKDYFTVEEMEKFDKNINFVQNKINMICKKMP